MKQQIDNLGKVAVTIEEGYWDIKKPYDKLTVVERAGTGTTFISRKPVPIGTSILNRKYWIKFSKWSDIPYEITQRFGDSDELAISQKTLTNKFSDVETEIQKGDEALDQRLRVVEVHERIMVNGGELEVATTEDLENPQTPRQEAAVPTVRAILDASDDEPHLNSTKRFINSNNLAKMYGYYLDNPEFIYVLTDDEYRIVLGVKTDGDIVFGVTVPSQIKEYIDSRINEILGVDDVTEKIDTIYEMIAFFDTINHDTTLKQLLETSAASIAAEKERAEAAEQTLYNTKANKDEVNAALDTKVDKEEGKSLIDAEYAEGVSQIENLEFIEAKTDRDGKLLEARKVDGTKVEYCNLHVKGNIINKGIQSQIDEAIEDMQQEVHDMLSKAEGTLSYFEQTDNPEWLSVITDSDGRILEGIKKNGKKYIANISSDSSDKSIEDILNTLGVEYDNRDTIHLSYVVEPIEITTETISKVGERINNDEYALIVPEKLIYKDKNGYISIVESSREGVQKHKYEYCSNSGTIEKYGNKYRLSFRAAPFVPNESVSFDIREEDDQFIEYDIADWQFTTMRYMDADQPNPTKGYYPQLFLCYDFMDNLVRKYPNRITKYDPMASEAYIENGITIQPLTSIRNNLIAAGYDDWPIYAKGIEEEGRYTFNGYTKTLLPTPAYKTFIYKVHSDNFIMGEDFAQRNKRDFYVQAGIHPAEVMSQIGICLFTETLVCNNINSYTLLCNYNFWIVPCLDGYSGMHGYSETAAEINANRNYNTPWWKFAGLDHLDESGYVSGDQFPTKLSMELIDYINPDIYLDLHSLNDTLWNPSLQDKQAWFQSLFSKDIIPYIANAYSISTKKMVEKYPSLFENVVPTIVIQSDYPNDARSPSYAAYKNPKAISATIEVNNKIAENDAMVNTSEALSAGAYYIRNGIYAMCKYNLEHCKSVKNN